MKKFFALLCGVALLVAPAAWSATKLNPYTGKFDFIELPVVTVANLPAAGAATNQAYIVSDGSAVGDCSTGGGDVRNICISNGSAWTVAGDAGGEGTTEVEDQALTAENFDGDTTKGVSQDDFHDWAIIHDTDLDGKVNVLDLTAGIVKTDADGVVSTATAGTDYYNPGGTDVALADGGTGASLSDPNADRILFWDDDPGAVTWLSLGSGLSITGTELTATGSGDVTSIGGTGEGACTSGDCLDGTSGGGNFIRLYDGNSHYTQLAAGDSTGNLTFTFPTAAPGANDAIVVMSTAGAMSTVAATTYQAADTELAELAAIEPAQGDIIYYNGSDWVALTAGVSGQYLQTQGAAANPQWASTAISGDVEDVGDCSSGACFTADGTGNTLYFEGSTANAYEVILTATDPTDEDKTITLPAATGTVVLGPASFAADNILIKTDYAAGKVTLTQATGITVDDNNDMSGGRNLNITGDLTVQGDDITLTTNTSGAVLVADGTNFNPVVMSGDITIGTDGTTAIGADKIKDTMVDWGTGAGQVSLDDVTDGSSYQKVAAADVDASGHVNVLTDIDGTGAITVTGPTATRAITIDDADQELAARNRANTFTGNNTFGDADTDTLTIRSLLVGGNSRALWIAGSAPTPTYATGTNELYVAGDIETAGTVYANTFVSTASGDSYLSLSNNAGGYAGTGYQLYFETDSVDVLSYSLNGSEKRVANLSDTQTFTAAKTFAAATSFNRGATGAGQLLIYEDSDDGSNYVTLTVPALAGNYTLTMPTTDGNSGQYLKTDGDGNTSWDTPTATAATDGSTEGVVQFNTSGAIDADASLKYTEASYTLLIGESNGSSLDGKLQLFNEGGTDYTVTIQPGSQSADATITLPGSDSTLATLGLAETFSGNKTFSGTVTMSANSATFTHSGTTSLTIASTSGYVGIESVRVAGGDITYADSIAPNGAADFDIGTTSTTTIDLISAGAFSFNGPADTDLTLTFNGTTASGVLKWMEDEDYFQFSDSVVIDLNLTVTGTTTHSDNVTIADGKSITFDESAADPNDADVKLSGADGVLTIASVNGDQADQQALTIDLDQTDAEIVVGATNATKINFSALNLVTTGTIDGGIPNTTSTTATVTVSGMGGIYWNGDDDVIEFDLPADPTNKAFCFGNNAYANAITVDPDDSDYITMDGTTAAQGEAIVSSGNKKDWVCVVGVDASNWRVTGSIGTWAEATP